MPIQEDINYYIEEINKLGFENKLNLSVTETSKILGISRSHLHTLITKNIGLDYIELGNKILFPKKSIAEFQVNKSIKSNIRRKN
ncbi:helix-turn-helix domain-containing protein [Aliarcobacter skirrowii]|uniref:helix-turn-helix domain-containing protein n=1 Tax=Aliarcobacter skirrowii TaxID=28200 RepID=UPI00082CEEC4|nr:helix-turn-helix domain-containing protein [Aliarcobacter skirrowii]